MSYYISRDLSVILIAILSRFKRENVFLIGIIPGPSEPRFNINAFLSLLVDEFLILWKDSVRLKHSGSLIFPAGLFRAALLCVTCDIPASRNVCGFTQHKSKHGCNKCTKEFDVGVMMIQLPTTQALNIVVPET